MGWVDLETSGYAMRRFFPETWTLSWCGETCEERLAAASLFGISEGELERVMAWADEAFGTTFGAWDAFFTLGDARAAAREFLRDVPDLELWGVGLHRSLADAFCAATAPPPHRLLRRGAHLLSSHRAGPSAAAGAGHGMVAVAHRAVSVGD